LPHSLAALLSKSEGSSYGDVENNKDEDKDEVILAQLKPSILPSSENIELLNVEPMLALRLLPPSILDVPIIKDRHISSALLGRHTALFSIHIVTLR
jgi:hypothetical protein